MAIERQVSLNKINVVGMSSNRNVHFVLWGAGGEGDYPDVGERR